MLSYVQLQQSNISGKECFSRAVFPSMFYKQQLANSSQLQQHVFTSKVSKW